MGFCVSLSPRQIDTNNLDTHTGIVSKFERKRMLLSPPNDLVKFCIHIAFLKNLVFWDNFYPKPVQN